MIEPIETKFQNLLTGPSSFLLFLTKSIKRANTVIYACYLRMLSNSQILNIDRKAISGLLSKSL